MKNLRPFLVLFLLTFNYCPCQCQIYQHNWIQHLQSPQYIQKKRQMESHADIIRGYLAKPMKELNLLNSRDKERYHYLLSDRCSRLYSILEQAQRGGYEIFQGLIRELTFQVLDTVDTVHRLIMQKKKESGDLTFIKGKDNSWQSIPQANQTNSSFIWIRGQKNTVDGDQIFVDGTNNKASGKNLTVSGNYLNVQGKNIIVVGNYQNVRLQNKLILGKFYIDVLRFRTRQPFIQYVENEHNILFSPYVL